MYLKLGALVVRFVSPEQEDSLEFSLSLSTSQVKQVSKPVAAQLKSSALAHPALREALRAVGQRMHEYNATLTQRLKSEGELATGRRVFVTRLDDETAMKKAADFMAEVFIFSVRTPRSRLLSPGSSLFTRRWRAWRWHTRCACRPRRTSTRRLPQ